MDKFLSFQVGKIVGTPRQGGGAWVLALDPPDPEQKSSRGSLFAVCDISTKADFDCFPAGKLVFGTLGEEYFSNLEGSPLSALERACSLAAKKLSSLAFAGGEEASLLEFNLVAAAIWGEVLYLSNIGFSQAAVFRGGKLKIILGDNKDKIEVASGILSNKDIVVLSSPHFRRIVTEVEFMDSIMENTVQNCVEILAARIHGGDDSATAAALIIGIEESFDVLPSDLEEAVAFSLVHKEEKNFLKEIVAAAGKRMAGGGDFIKSFFPKREQSAIFLRSEKSPKKTGLFLIVIFLAVLLFFSVYSTLIKKDQDQREANFEKLYLSAQNNYEQAISIIELSPARTRELLNLSRNDLEEARKIRPKDVKLADLTNSILSTLERVANVNTVEPGAFWDLNLVKNGSTGESLVLSGNTLWMLDKKGGAVISLGLPNKEAQIVASQNELIDGSFLGVSGDNLYILIANRGVLNFNVRDRKITEVIKQETVWGEIGEMTAFAGNIYLLDRTKKQIWKYIALKDGFSTIRNYLSEEGKEDFAHFAIDGSVWVISQKGDILKFTQGKADSFSISGLDEKISGASLIFTDGESKNLYILDKNNQKILVVTKGGEYVSSYKSEKLGQISDFAVREKDKKIYLLGGSRIYTIDLK